ncbi:MAG: hypothetical protein SFX74_00840 [Fimbriimonadaceae bacterium]|nr:hypothetical protein [Fimbriimonadaceae bacterium]
MERQLETEDFRIPRFELAYIGAIAYVRTFWWFVAIIPLSGLLLVTLGTGFMRAAGAMALLWPATIPARSLMASGKTSRSFERGLRAWFEGDRVYFATGDESGFQMAAANVRAVFRIGKYAILQTRRFAVLPIPFTAWPGTDPEVTLRALEQWRATSERSDS